VAKADWYAAPASPPDGRGGDGGSGAA